MEKLELKHLAPYLPYGLRVNIYSAPRELKYKNRSLRSFKLQMGFKDIHLICEKSRVYYIDAIKPILHSLDDLGKELLHNGEKFNPEDKIAKRFKRQFKKMRYNQGDLTVKHAYLYPYEIVEKLIEWHFDVFGLIEKGLAVDINTLNNAD